MPRFRPCQPIDEGDRSQELSVRAGRRSRPDLTGRNVRDNAGIHPNGGTLVHGHVIFHDGRTCQDHVILQDRRTSDARHAAHANSIAHCGVVSHLAQVVDFDVVADGGVRQQTTVHTGLHSELKSIADANRPQMRQTVSWSAGGIIKAKAFSPHHRVFVQRPVLTKLTIATQNGVVSQVGSCTNFCPSAHL